MSKFNLQAICLASGLVLTVGATAQTLVDRIDAFELANDRIGAQLLAQDNRFDPDALVVSSSSQGTVAFAAYHIGMLNLNLATGTNLGMLYVEPSRDSSSPLQKGFYSVIVKSDPTLGVAALFEDKNGNIAQRGKVNIDPMLFQPEPAEPLKPGYSMNVSLDSEGLAEMSIHVIGFDRCWIEFPDGISLHGDNCWLSIIPIEL